MKESCSVAEALRSLVKSRLQGSQDAQSAVLSKRTINREHGNFVMMKVGRMGRLYLTASIKKVRHCSVGASCPRLDASASACQPG